MQCDNCGYIFFQPSRKCACCSAPYAPTQTAFDIGQENLFTIFEMAPGEGGTAAGMATAGAGVGVEDYHFTDDFDMGGAEYGVDENVLDLSEAEAEGFGPGASIEAAGVPASADDFEYDAAAMGGMALLPDDIGPDDFELDLTGHEGQPASVAPEAEAAVPDISPESEPEVSLDISPESEGEPEVDAAADADFGGSGFDSEVEGLGFGFDESPAKEAPEAEAATEEITLDATPEAEAATEEITLDTAPEPEAEISLEPELELPADEPADEEPSLELSDEPDEEPSLELSDEPELDMGGEEIELSDETGLDASMDDTGDYEEEDAGGIDFDIDSVDLDAPEEEIIVDEQPEAVDTGEESPLEIEGLEMEMENPEESEEDNPEK